MSEFFIFNMYKHSKYSLILYILLFFLFIQNISGQNLPNKSEVVSVMQLVNDYWINGHSNPGNNGWARSAYFTGNMAMYDFYPAQEYFDYAYYWAELNNWAPGSRPRHADDHCCGQTYCDLFFIEPDTSKIIQINQVIADMVNSVKKDDWWWIDALYMDMPVFTRLGIINNDNAYFDKMYDLYEDTKERRALYDTTDHLWFRDENYSASEDTTPNGEKIFWSRGNGWVFGGHVRTLKLLPVNDPNRSEYIQTFLDMADALKNAQRSDGFWGVSLADSNHYPGPETSGTGFFTYGLAWGINTGLLDSAVYFPVVQKAWTGMVNDAVHPDGFLGYVQGVGNNPGSSQPVTYDSTTDFGVGAFLLAGSEVVNLAPGDMPVPPPQPVNLALNNLYKYSSQQLNPFNPASNAVDGDVTTRWSAQTFPQWIEIDLGEKKPINETVVVPYINRAYQYIIEGRSDTTVNYITIVDRINNTTGGMAIVDTFDIIETRYVKLTVVGAHVYTGDWCSILEFKIFGDLSTEFNDNKMTKPISTFELFAAYPNPFNSTTNIRFLLTKGSNVKVNIYNSLGQHVITLLDHYVSPGEHIVHWNGTQNNGVQVSSGVYFYKIQIGLYSAVKKMILVK